MPLLRLDVQVGLLPEITWAQNRRLVRHGVSPQSHSQTFDISEMNLRALVAHWVLDIGARFSKAARLLFPQERVGKLQLNDLYELLSGQQRDQGAFRKMMQRMGASFPVEKLDILSS